MRGLGLPERWLDRQELVDNTLNRRVRVLVSDGKHRHAKRHRDVPVVQHYSDQSQTHSKYSMFKMKNMLKGDLKGSDFHVQLDVGEDLDLAARRAHPETDSDTSNEPVPRVVTHTQTREHM